MPSQQQWNPENIDWNALQQSDPQLYNSLGAMGMVPNYQGTQNAAQTGGYNSTGNTNQTQNATTNQNTTGTSDQTSLQSTNQNQSGTSIGTTSGQTTSQGQTTQNDIGSQLVNAATQNNQSTATNGAARTTDTGLQSTSQSGTSRQVGQVAGNASTRAYSPVDVTGALNSQVGGLSASDANVRSYLTDFMQNGGTGFNSQVDKAVRQAQSGPNMTGAGQSAQARAAGYAASDVARNNAGQRLQAASQLSGPTGLGTLTSQIAPLMGSDTTQQQTNATMGNTSTAGTTASNNTSNQLSSNLANTTGTQTAQTGTQSNNASSQNTTGGQQSSGTNYAANNATTTGASSNATTGNTSSNLSGVNFQNLVGNEENSGSATGQSTSSNIGTAPPGAQQSGGCVVCTAYVSKGWMSPGAVRRAVKWKLAQPKYRTSIYGYMLYGPFLARLVLSSRLFASVFYPVARAILYHEVYLSLPTRLRWRLLPCVTHAVFDRLSWPVGVIFGRRGVQCPKVLALLRRENLIYEV